MGNASNENLWFPRTRLAFLERRAKKHGTLRRRDLQEFFGVSLAQASADLQRYQELNPGALLYSTKRKEYIWNKEAKLIFDPTWLNFPLSRTPADSEPLREDGESKDRKGLAG